MALYLFIYYSIDVKRSWCIWSNFPPNQFKGKLCHYQKHCNFQQASPRCDIEDEQRGWKEKCFTTHYLQNIIIYKLRIASSFHNSCIFSLIHSNPKKIKVIRFPYRCAIPLLGFKPITIKPKINQQGHT